MRVPGEANGRKYNITHALLLQPSSWLTCYCLDTFPSSSSSKLSRGCWGDCGSSDDYYGDWYDPYGVDTDDDYYRGNDGYFYQYSGRRF